LAKSFAKEMDGRGISAFTRVFRRAMPGHDGARGTTSSAVGGASCWKIFLTTPNYAIDYVSCLC